MTPKLDFAEKLAEKGYWIFPTYNRQKGARQVMGKPWGWYLDNSSPEVVASMLSRTSPSGASLCLNPSDPVQLLILDFDLDPKAGITWEKLWDVISTGLPVPDGLGVTRSISGGFHVWFKLPGKVKLPDKFDLGSGIAGEIRASTRPKTFIMLPGSIALNKEGKPGRYKMDMEIAVDKLPEPPPSLMARLSSRTDRGNKEATNSRGIPTELSHFLEILDETEFPEGQRNETIAKVGQIFGRIIPSSDLSPEILSATWTKLGPKLGRGFNQKEFLKTIHSGFRTGRANANKFNKREKHPTVTDIDSECSGIFGGTLWSQRLVDSSAKTVGYVVGVGGSEKRPDEAEIAVQIEPPFNIDEILPALAKATRVDPDVVVTSPIFIQPGWKKVLEFALKRRSSIEPIAMPPEDVFLEKLNSWAKSAAANGYLIERWTEKRSFDKGSPFLVHPTDGEDLTLVLPERSYERALRQMGDIAQARTLGKKYLLQKTLVGRSKTWTLASLHLDEGTRATIKMAYEKKIEERMRGK